MPCRAEDDATRSVNKQAYIRAITNVRLLLFSIEKASTAFSSFLIYAPWNAHAEHTKKVCN